jgi:hypothetical protein
MASLCAERPFGREGLPLGGGWSLALLAPRAGHPSVHASVGLSGRGGPT